MNAVIIDDEPICVDNLRYHLDAYCSDVSVVATGHNLCDARNIFSNCSFDVAFLDIELFSQNIFELFDDPAVVFPFGIVFVTAYDAYAIRAIRVDALDYLLKPLSREDIVNCCERIKKRRSAQGLELPATGTDPKTSLKKRKIILKGGNQVYVVPYADILYLRAQGAYTEVVFLEGGRKKSVVISKSINTLERDYDDACFRRVHKSFVVNTVRITAILRKGGMVLEIEGTDLVPVAKRRVHEFFSGYNNTAC